MPQPALLYPIAAVCFAVPTSEAPTAKMLARNYFPPMTGFWFESGPLVPLSVELTSPKRRSESFDVVFTAADRFVFLQLAAWAVTPPTRDEGWQQVRLAADGADSTPEPLEYQNLDWLAKAPHTDRIKLGDGCRGWIRRVDGRIRSVLFEVRSWRPTCCLDDVTYTQVRYDYLPDGRLSRVYTFSADDDDAARIDLHWDEQRRVRKMVVANVSSSEEQTRYQRNLLLPSGGT